MEEKTQRITHDGILRLANQFEIPCYVTEKEIRVLSGRGVQNVLKITDEKYEGQKPGSRLKRLLNYKPLKSLILDRLSPDQLEPIKCINKGTKINGYDATMLIDICDIIIEMENSGIRLTDRQKIIAKQAEIIIRAVAKVGIIALIDEATGYQYVRDRIALQEILDKYLLKDYAKWAKRFPNEFYQRMFQLKGWQWNGMKINRPSVVGTYTNDIVYSRLAPGILTELKRLNPPDEKGQRKIKHHQWLTEEIGHPALQQHLITLIAFMKAAPNWGAFHRMIERAFPKFGETIPIALEEK